MEYQTFSRHLNSKLSISFGFSFKSAGRLKSNESILDFFQNIYPSSSILIMNQQHTNNVSIVIKPTGSVTTYSKTDALFYSNPDTSCFLVAKTADCLPIIVWDAKGNLGIAHAGWRGSLEEILPKLLGYFLTQSPPENVYVFIGPSIGFCCYPIYGDRLTLFHQRFKDWQDEIIIKDQNRLSLDLKRLNWLQATAMGIPAKNISILPSCTSCQTDSFFSYTKDKAHKGNIINWIGLI